MKKLDYLQAEKERLKQKLKRIQDADRQVQIEYTKSIKEYNIAKMHEALRSGEPK